MANLVRSAKSANKWTLKDLDSYNISLNEVDPLSFFGLQELPQPTVDHEMLNNVDAEAMQRGRNSRLIRYIDHAMIPEWGQSAVIDFTAQLLEALDYRPQLQLISRRVPLPLFICGEDRHARACVAIVDFSQFDTILLVVQAHKRMKHGEPVNVRAQLVAEALGAFNQNNAQREASGRPPLAEKVMPGILMLGTLPIFFKIPVTQNLATHVGDGTFPPDETRVTFCYPPVPACRYSEGIKPLDNRREIFKCLEAFKAIVGV